MKVESFEQIIAWQKAKILSLLIYNLFSNNKDYGFRDQIQRSSVSILNNIAEGYERNGNKEFKHFLYIAKGSAAEVRSMLRLAYDLKYINKSDFARSTDLSYEISKLLSGFIKIL